MEKAQGFEIAEYDPEDLPVAEQLSVLKQIMEDRKLDPNTVSLPSENFVMTLQGNQLRMTYHSYEMQLNHPSRIKDVEDLAEKSLNVVMKFLKKEFKSRTKKVLSVKELKDKRDYAVNKVSLNERYYFTSWRVYSIDLAVR